MTTYPLTTHILTALRTLSTTDSNISDLNTSVQMIRDAKTLATQILATTPISITNLTEERDNFRAEAKAYADKCNALTSDLERERLNSDQFCELAI
jgi:hypothetical protein